MNNILLTKGWISIPHDEIFALKQKMVEQYKNDVGSKEFEDFNTHFPNYEEFVKLMKIRLEKVKKTRNIEILIDGKEYSHISPGKFFLKHLFYTKRNDPKPQFQRVNIDICYLYASGKTRHEQFLSENEQDSNSNHITKRKSTVENDTSDIKIVVSYTINNMNEAENIEEHLTENFGVEIESDIRNSFLYNKETLDPNHDNYYDWLSHEILNQQPEYCFIPFGTGDLFIHVMNIVKKEYFNHFLRKHDPCFSGDVENLKKCHFIGAISRNPETMLDKLYSIFLPSYKSYKKFISELYDHACLGYKTGIHEVNKKYVYETMDIAQAQNINFETSGIAVLALLNQMRDEIPANERILIVNTGKTKMADELLKNMAK